VPIRATLPGCFYRARDPKSPPFVNEGDHVQEDEPLFIMECNKRFTEIPSPVSGIIVKIFAENNKPVKNHDQIVMYIEPDDKSLAVKFNLEGQEIEDEKEKDPYIHSKVVGTVWRIKGTDSPWLVNLGDVVQPNQPILTINQLNKIVKVTYEGDCPAIITQQLVLEGEPVQYGTPVAKVEFLE
jgi:biotin carboxyl carrier protein